ncbi:YSIRK-type signal peptide-containing protein [Streptococcus parauberis]|uniref:YSIRK-type signal peptide-containing protein n=1 Tax=Streptococcus parauberis TaxID=1348 RepID=UPI00288D1CCD|nr:YSIRK-type signal peptide-containing protein [Streptococcus parauberis]MDT2750175.1 YSIRK-type signal peptide-containing protein [Streptococcus parauberis]
MKENKQMKYFLRKSIFGLASVSAAFIVGGSFVSADEASTNKYIESIADNIDKVDSNDLMKKLSGLKTTSEVDNALKALSESDSANRDAYTAVLANSDVLATRTASQGVEIMDADREAYREINRLGETLHDPTRLEAAIKELTEAKTLDAISAAVNHAHILASEEYNSGISMTDESSDAEWLKAAEDAEKSKISEDEDQTTEDAEEDDVETVSEESDAEADVNAEEDMEDEEDEDEEDEDEVDEDEVEDEDEDAVEDEDENEDEEEDSVDENEGNKEDPKINITPSPKEKETKESRQAMRDKLMAETKEREAKAAKERLEKERSTALTELDHLGAGRLLKNIVSTAKTVEGIKEFMAITRPSLEHAMKVKATSGLTDFLKSQRSAEDTVKDIILTNAKNAALKKLEKLGATDHLKELVENAKTVEDIRTLMAEATPSLEATLSKEEADQVAPEVSEEAPMGSENPMPEGVETDTESSEILNTDKDVERQATGKSVLADTEGKASAPFVQTDAKKTAMEATKEKTPVKAEETKKADQHLPVTGEKVNPFFTGVALSIIASAGMVAYSTKRKEN